MIYLLQVIPNRVPNTNYNINQLQKYNGYSIVIATLLLIFSKITSIIPGLRKNILSEGWNVISQLE